MDIWKNSLAKRAPWTAEDEARAEKKRAEERERYANLPESAPDEDEEETENEDTN